MPKLDKSELPLAAAVLGVILIIALAYLVGSTSTLTKTTPYTVFDFIVYSFFSITIGGVIGFRIGLSVRVIGIRRFHEIIVAACFFVFSYTRFFIIPSLWIGSL